MLRRKIEDTLLAWKQDVNRKPIIIKGCRQCGKTLSVQKFAEDNLPVINDQFPFKLIVS